MESSYYRKYYLFERRHWWFVVRAGILQKVIKRFIPGIPHLNILNTGVATGRTTEILAQYGQVTSIEPDTACCRFLREELHMEVTEASVTDMPFGAEKFDVVCVLDVLEHVPDDRLAVSEIHRVTRPNGWLVVTVPAYPWLWSMHDEINHHQRRYTPPAITTLLQENGYHIEYMSGFNFWLFPPIAAFRLLARVFRRKNSPVRSDFEIPFFHAVPFLNRFFYFIFNLEKKMLPGIKFPFGLSILVVARKV
jgi:SAM-dependent methyltransferase